MKSSALYCVTTLFSTRKIKLVKLRNVHPVYVHHTRNHAIYPVKFCSVLHNTRPAFCPSCVKQPVHSHTRMRAFFSPRRESNLHGERGRVWSENTSPGTKGLLRYHARSRQKYFPRLFFFFYFILLSGCAHPFARIDRKLLDQKQTHDGGEVGSSLSGATPAQRQIVREKWRVKSWKEARIRGGGSVVRRASKDRRLVDGCGLIVGKMRSVDTLIFRGTNFATTIHVV